MTTSTHYETEDFRREPRDVQYSDKERAISTQSQLALNDPLTVDIRKRRYNQQYASIYYMRLEMLRPRIQQVARDAWQGMKINDIAAHECKKVLDARQGKLVWLAGTVYRELQYKPNILEEVTAKTYGPPTEIHDKYIGGSEDKTILEDESGRMELCGDMIKQEPFVTGTTIAVLGTEDSAGNFQVIDIKYPGFSPQTPRPEVMNDSRRYVAIASGLDIGAKDENHTRLDLLQEWLSGELGGQSDQAFVSNISALVLAGNSLAEQSAEHPGKKKYGRDTSVYDAQPLTRFDRFLSDTLMSLDVVVMPGPTDPANATMPQQALHKGLFMSARAFVDGDNGEGLNLVTNPYTLDIDGTHILGSAGQPLDDIFKYYDRDNNRLKMMERMLKWQHQAPTCPDTLWGYPFSEIDPFVLKSTPHVFFVGNQGKYDSTVVTEGDVSVRLVTVPKFSQTGQIVLLDLDTLETRVVQIG